MKLATALFQPARADLFVKNYAVLIALEEYADRSIDGVPYAQRDAEEFSKVLALHGFDKSTQVILINRQATKGGIESKVSQLIRRLRKEDTLYFFYAGRGFTNAAQDFIACYDTHSTDWEGTSLALARILAEMQASKCERIVLFLDRRPCRIETSSGIHGTYRHSQTRELEALLQHDRRCTCFSACGDDQTSHSSNHLHHSIWTYHLIEAFKGDAPLALNRGRLTAHSLQNYLKLEVPRTLRHEIPSPGEQTPWICGAANDDFVLADLRDVLETRRASANRENAALGQVSLTIERTKGIRSLSGWKKHYRVPELFTDATASFAIGCAAGELEHDLDQVFERLKRAFGFTRRDLKASELKDGTGTITTPYFNYSITFALNPERLDEVIWARTVDAIKAPAQIVSQAFAEVFDGVFDTLELSLPAAVDVEEFIDAVEATEIAEVSIAYDREATYCELQLEGAAATVTLRDRSLSVVHPRPQKAHQLIASFDIVRRFVQQHNLPLISGP